MLILRLSGFMDFYREACQDRLDAVWNDLQCHGFRYDLKRDEAFIEGGEEGRQAEAGREAASEAASPRSIIAQHLEYSQLLFELLVLSEREEEEQQEGGAGGRRRRTRPRGAGRQRVASAAAAEHAARSAGRAADAAACTHRLGVAAVVRVPCTGCCTACKCWTA